VGVSGSHQPRPRCPRRLGSGATPSGTGGSPDAVQSSSPHASTCGPRSSGPSPEGSLTGVHEARISSCALGSSPSMLPKLSEDTFVTVPDGATYLAPCAVSASLSQDQPTSASSGSLAISGSISARA